MSEPFVIARRFSTVDEMHLFFAKSSTLSEVSYGQYVLIDTVLKADRDNGKIYCRGFNGAEYIGQIVGPQGPAPEIHFVEHNETQDGQVAYAIGQNFYKGLPLENEGDPNKLYCSWENIQDDDHNVKGVALDLQIPYHHFGFSANPANWWEQAKVVGDDINSSHYHDYFVEIPKYCGIILMARNGSICCK